MPRARGGYKRSRALWDEARRKDASWMATVRAILYELQPFRFATLLEQGNNMEAWKEQVVAAYADGKTFVVERLPKLTKETTIILRENTSNKTGLYLALGLLYCYGVRYIHRTLDAGPLVVMISTLVVIFTIGLGDRNDGGMSAYSVFNRGYQQLLGSVDADALVQQHVGGGMAAAAVMMPQAAGNQQPPPPRVRDEVAPVIQRPQQQQLPDDDIDDTNDNNEDGPAAPGGRSRRSRKKQGQPSRQARQEQRQELEQQRQAARDLGFGGDDESAAMQRILEEQIAANQLRQNQQEGE